VPSGQREQNLLPGSEYWPREQFWQTDSLVALKATENLPLGHMVQLLATVSGWYVPPGHARQLLEVFRPSCVEYRPVPQGWQDCTLSWPRLDEYVPAGQGWHARLEFAPTVGEYFPAGQSVHVAEDVAPVSALNFPPTHRSHFVGVAMPMALENVPGSHFLQ
jgi:hypothetical protein